MDNRKNESEPLSAMISKVRGTRTLKQFSEDTGVSLSMLSRYINGRGSKPTPRTLMKLANPDSDPQNGVTYDDLLIAADYQSIGTALRVERIEEDKVWDRMEASDIGTDILVNSDTVGASFLVESKSDYTVESKRNDRLQVYQERLIQKEAIIKSILLDNDDLYSRGWRKIGRDELPLSIGRGRRNQIIFRNIEKPEQLWVMEIKCEVYDKAVSKEYLYRRLFMQQMGYYAGLTLDENRKVTVVTESEGLFSKFVEHEGCSYQGDFSVMLVDLDKYQIVNEKYLTHFLR